VEDVDSTGVDLRPLRETVRNDMKIKDMDRLKV
jgi:hypothetical protein